MPVLQVLKRHEKNEKIMLWKLSKCYYTDLHLAQNS